MYSSSEASTSNKLTVFYSRVLFRKAWIHDSYGSLLTQQLLNVRNANRNNPQLSYLHSCSIFSNDNTGRSGKELHNEKVYHISEPFQETWPSGRSWCPRNATQQRASRASGGSLDPSLTCIANNKNIVCKMYHVVDPDGSLHKVQVGSNGMDGGRTKPWCRGLVALLQRCTAIRRFCCVFGIGHFINFPMMRKVPPWATWTEVLPTMRGTTLERLNGSINL